MKKTLLLPALFLTLTTVALSQKDYDKSVKTKYLSLPTYDVTITDPSTITAEYAMDDPTFGVEKLKDMESTCVPKGGGLKDAVKVTTYYYEMSFGKPESFVVAKDPSGNIVYASQTSVKEDGTIKFGHDKCEYWQSDKLKKDWASGASGFKSKESSKYASEVFKIAEDETKANIFLSYNDQEFDVYGAKGKDFDYVELEEAFDKALEAYKNIGNKGANQADFDKLTECIVVWEKELAKLDSEDKKARISVDIAKGLHENCTRAYMYMYNFDKAIEHGRAFQKMWGNFHTNRTNDFDVLMKNIEMQKIAAEKNKAIMSDISALNAKAEATAKNSIKLSKLGSADFARLRVDHMKFRGSQLGDINEARKEEEDAAIASGELNPYQKYVSTATLTGSSIMMTMAPSPLSGFPELTELPKEMCELTELKTLIIMNNKIESVPAEIANLTELTKLDLSGNSLKTLPAEIGELANLETLKLSKNPIESLPKEIANCTNLKTLVLKNTSLTSSQEEELQLLLPDCKIKF